jgi:hypothetical protein
MHGSSPIGDNLQFSVVFNGMDIMSQIGSFDTSRTYSVEMPIAGSTDKGIWKETTLTAVEKATRVRIPSITSPINPGNVYRPEVFQNPAGRFSLPGNDEYEGIACTVFARLRQEQSFACA